jgi:transposase
MIPSDSKVSVHAILSALGDLGCGVYFTAVMADSTGNGCPNCKRLEKRLAELEVRFAQLEAELAKARKNSGNSSKPPSSDIVKLRAKPPRKRGRQKQKQGAQPGHPRHERPPFPPDQIDNVWEYRLDACPCCGGGLKDAKAEDRVLQQVELQPQPTIIEEHRQVAQRCTKCQRVHYAGLPEELARAGLIGPRLTALVGFLKGACHMSFSTIRKFFRDVIGVRVSRGLLAKLIGKVRTSLQDPYEELLRMLPEQDVLNVDETGHKDRGKSLWTWCFRATLFTLYKISPSRGSDVLLDVLGKEFDGVLGCDYFSAYRKYMRLNENVTLQFCLAHFIRDVKFLAEHPDRRNRMYGKQLVEDLRRLFHILHRRDEYASEATFRQALQRIERAICWDAFMESPRTRESENIAERFRLYAENFFSFITTPGVEPTNNLAEQAIRFVAIHRKITQGTRGQAGQTWCERIWTVIGTCAQTGRSVFEFLHSAINATFAGTSAPTLVPNSS